jgi:ABC-type multidrug transport system fused ATPase/permease subunit
MFNKPRLDAVYDIINTINKEEMYKLTVKSEGNEEKNQRISFEDELQVKDVIWKYPSGKKPVLNKLNIDIKKGQSVAFVGPSGAGKTTLADLILGLFKPQEGKITVDGFDIYENLWAWSKMVGYVPQSVFLTDDTIRNNIAFGIDEEMIDDERIWESLREAQLEDFVKNLPDGLDTFVGEGGMRISGGQRQRIAIARALYQNPMILVLDEATSALDNDTEAAVMDAIESLHGTKTLIIVAHRLSTIQNCDVIYEINNGVATRREGIETIRYSNTERK